MDVLDPELEEIDGCVYRVNVVDHQDSGRNAENTPYSEYGNYYTYKKPDLKFV